MIIQLGDLTYNADFINDQFTHLLKDADVADILKTYYYGAITRYKEANATPSERYLYKPHCIARVVTILTIELAKHGASFKFIAPKDEFGTIIMDIADSYADSSQVTADALCEGISAMLMECYKGDLLIDDIIRVFHREFLINNYNSLCDPVCATSFELSRPIASSSDSDREAEAWKAKNASAYQTEYVDNKGIKHHYNAMTATTEERRERLANDANLFKNKQCRDRALAKFDKIGV